jgi:hypothetical protein
MAILNPMADESGVVASKGEPVAQGTAFAAKAA